MKIIFLNAWHGKQKEELEAFILEHRETTDIFCFQEANQNLAKITDEILLDFFQAISGTKKSSEEGFNFKNKTYVRKGVKIEDSGVLLDGVEGAGLAFWTSLDFKGRKILLVNVHGESRPGNKLDTEARIFQSQEIIDFLEEKEGLKIVGGDFNLFPETQSVKLFAQNGYRNLINDFKIDTTRNELAWKLYPDKQLWADYTFVSAEVGVKSFTVPKNTVSDHLPMILEFA